LKKIFCFISKPAHLVQNWTYLEIDLIGLFTRKSDFALSLQVYLKINNFLFFNMNQINTKMHPEIGRVNKPNDLFF
jgi:hypothetical protein